MSNFQTCVKWISSTGILIPLLKIWNVILIVQSKRIMKGSKAKNNKWKYDNITGFFFN